MSTGIRSFDPDDFFDDRRRDIERQRAREDRQRQMDDADRRFADSEARRALEEQRLATLDQERARLDAMMTLVNDDKVDLNAEQVKVINDPNMRMMPNGEIVARIESNARDVIRRSGQFSRQNLLPSLPQTRVRRRKKTKTDKNMSAALREANKKFRKANGQLRKGKTQAQLMRYAHKLLRRMSK